MIANSVSPVSNKLTLCTSRIGYKTYKQYSYLFVWESHMCSTYKCFLQVLPSDDNLHGNVHSTDVRGHEQCSDCICLPCIQSQDDARLRCHLGRRTDLARRCCWLHQNPCHFITSVAIFLLLHSTLCFCSPLSFICSINSWFVFCFVRIVYIKQYIVPESIVALCPNEIPFLLNLGVTLQCLRGVVVPIQAMYSQLCEFSQKECVNSKRE